MKVIPVSCEQPKGGMLISLAASFLVRTLMQRAECLLFSGH